MIEKIWQWIRSRYNKIIGSIAFFPAIIAIVFLLLSWGMLVIDFSGWGKHLKSQLSWLSLKDASTARVIISTVVAGVMSLTVFSFSMVMIVLNQAASQMSNRMLTSMIENRFQQVVLGFYIGTIVYALFLLSTIRDINSGIYVPALSIYLLIILTVIDILLFIYFLDYVTQTVKHETVIQRVQKQTMESMKEKYCDTPPIEEAITSNDSVKIYTKVSGYFQGIDRSQLLETAVKNDFEVSFVETAGTYLIAGSFLLIIHGEDKIEDEIKEKVFFSIDIFDGQPIDRNPEYGFHHLVEVALKALSPGINDPATAVLCINALSDLFLYRLKHYPPSIIKDKEGKTRITLKIIEFKDLFESCMYAIWHYGKDDKFIQTALIRMLEQLKTADTENAQTGVFDKILDIITSKEHLDELKIISNT